MVLVDNVQEEYGLYSSSSQIGHAKLASGKMWYEYLKKLVDSIIIIRRKEIYRNRGWWDNAKLQVIPVKFPGIFLNVNKQAVGFSEDKMGAKKGRLHIHERNLILGQRYAMVTSIFFKM
ncbi:hypothetical protein IMY05_001G0281000 [Salix suchowensis]|nr:hypothetical protein IMY05_001G0281000 [Salix suchowensis]